MALRTKGFVFAINGGVGRPARSVPLGAQLLAQDFADEPLGTRTRPIFDNTQWDIHVLLLRRVWSGVVFAAVARES